MGILYHVITDIGDSTFFLPFCQLKTSFLLLYAFVNKVATIIEHFLCNSYLNVHDLSWTTDLFVCYYLKYVRFLVLKLHLDMEIIEGWSACCKQVFLEPYTASVFTLHCLFHKSVKNYGYSLCTNDLATFLYINNFMLVIKTKQRNTLDYYCHKLEENE